jgi:serine phosphatase RsbU (regulator of sigma subunit)/anti-sigma regulatory factor (Ser/Thr protein kinase)
MSQGMESSLVRSLFGRPEVGLVVRDRDPLAGRVWCSPAFFGLVPAHDGGPARVRLTDLLVAEDAAAVEERLRRVLETGEPITDDACSVRRHDDPERDRIVSLSVFPLEDTTGEVRGAAALFCDITRHETARTQHALLRTSAHQLGRSLDVTRNAEHVTQLLVPEFADLACVDVTESVRQGGDATSFDPGTGLHRVAVAAADGSWPLDAYQLGDRILIRDEDSAVLRGGEAVLAPRLGELHQRVTMDAERRRLLFPSVASSALWIPLLARGHVLGVLGVWRGAHRKPFSQDDVRLMEPVASRTALSLDNARRYTRERRTVEELQRSLLPPPLRRTSAAESSGAYAPASSVAGTGGSWYDVIRLSGTRAAFVVGKVAGHGVHAAGAMGRLRSAVQTLADVDLPPEELLAHLDDLVDRLGKDEGDLPESVAGSLHGATCLYAAYDPVTGRCSVAAAGRPSALLARRQDGTAAEIQLQAGPPLGSGSREPFEAVELRLEAGDVLAFHDGLPADSPDTAEDLRHLHEGARLAARPDTPLADVADRLLTHLRAHARTEDLALLLARVDRVPPSRTAYWELTADPGQAALARTLASDRLSEWGLDDMIFSTELIVSELVTNAIRYAGGGPIGLRLIRDDRLICEVSDPSQSQPHLRRARLSDEGGRGLFLIAQLTDRWGSRYTPLGKTIWTEQRYPAEALG